MSTKAAEIYADTLAGTMDVIKMKRIDESKLKSAASSVTGSAGSVVKGFSVVTGSVTSGSLVVIKG